jgi:hypothetical protein
LRACPALEQLSKPQTSSASQLQACLTRLASAFHADVAYQPPSRFWPFQWAEMGIFLAAALTLCGLTYWCLQSRLA